MRRAVPFESPSTIDMVFHYQSSTMLVDVCPGSIDRRQVGRGPMARIFTHRPLSVSPVSIRSWWRQQSVKDRSSARWPYVFEDRSNTSPLVGLSVLCWEFVLSSFQYHIHLHIAVVFCLLLWNYKIHMNDAMYNWSSINILILSLEMNCGPMRGEWESLSIYLIFKMIYVHVCDVRVYALSMSIHVHAQNIERLLFSFFSPSLSFSIRLCGHTDRHMKTFKCA